MVSDEHLSRPQSAPDWTLALAVAAALVAQVAIFLGMFSRYDPRTVPTVLTASIPLASGIAAITLGYDATRVNESTLWWNPRAWVWAYAMIPVGLNLGLFVGYLLRRREAVREAVPGDRWVAVLVPAILLAHGGAGAMSAIPGQTTLVVVLSLWLVASAAFGLSIVAIYYDLSFVNAVLGTVDERWPLKGYHWILLVLALAPLLLFYYLRRRMLLSVVDDPPSDLLVMEWRPGEE